LLPQHWTVPFDRIAHVWKSPVAMALAPVTPVTATGVDERRIDVLVPSCPFVLPPQHWTVPLDSTAHACSKPTATPETPLRPETGIGVMK
jgi:hypothetical protein